MRIDIIPVTVDTPDGPVICSTADASVAVSTSTAIRLVPVDANGNQYPDAALGIVGDDTIPDVAAFMATVQTAVTDLARSRGI